MPAQFELYRDALGTYRWRLLSDSGRIVAKGGEGYATKPAALDAIELVRGSAAAVLDDTTDGSDVRALLSGREASSGATASAGRTSPRRSG